MLILGGLLLTFTNAIRFTRNGYVVVVGLESVTTFLLAAFLLGEEMTVFKIVATGIVMGEILALQLAD